MEHYELTTSPILCLLHRSRGEIGREIRVELSPEKGEVGERSLDLFLFVITLP